MARFFHQANRKQSLNYGCIVENQETNEVENTEILTFTKTCSYRSQIVLYLVPLGQVLHFVEKPSTFVSDIINCGIYLFTPEIFAHVGTVFQRNQEDRLL